MHRIPRSVRSVRSSRLQRGFATIFVTIVLLLAVGLIALYSNRAALVEQRLSANAMRAAQALAAADAGIDHALAYMNGPGGIDHNADGKVDSISANTLTQSSGGTPSYYLVAYYNPATALPTCPTRHTGVIPADAALLSTSTAVMAVSCGWSDDDSSVQRVVQLLSNSPSVAGSIAVPLVTRFATSLLTGGAAVLNYFNDLTVWSGGDLLGQSNTGKTFVRDILTNPVALPTDPYRTTGNSPACNNPPTGYACSTQGSTLGHDTITNDTSMSNLSSGDFFKFFFGQEPSSYRDNTAKFVVDLTGGLTTSNSTNINSIVGLTSTVIWVEGNASLPGDIGTKDAPVILIVNGDLQLGSNSVVNGLVYATGAITGSGSPTIYGALISAGTASANGNLTVVYDPNVLMGVTNLGKASKIPGSWRDW